MMYRVALARQMGSWPFAGGIARATAAQMAAYQEAVHRLAEMSQPEKKSSRGQKRLTGEAKRILYAKAAGEIK